MTPEQQRIRIAELQEWKRVSVHSWHNGNRDQKQWLSVDDLPDYLNSRDAIVPVLAGLTEEEERTRFVTVICYDVFKTVDHPSGIIGHMDLLLATPAQLSEAYLRTKGEWEK